MEDTLTPIGHFFTFCDSFQDLRQFFPHEDRDDGRRRFISTQPKIVAGIAATRTQFVRMTIHRHDERTHKNQELSVFSRRSPGFKQIHAFTGRQRPIIMFSGTVYPRKRFLMKKTDQIMAQRHLLHRLHHKLVMVRRNIGRRENRRHFVLSRCNFIMFGF